MSLIVGVNSYPLRNNRIGMDSPKDRKGLSKVKVNIVCFGMFEKASNKVWTCEISKTLDQKKSLKVMAN